MANCALCSQPGHEQVGHRGDYTAGNFHHDCAYLAYQLSVADNDPMPNQRKIIQRKIDKLVHKRSAVVDEYP